MEREFKGIWIPKEIWLSRDLTLQEKVFYVEISSLDNEDGCYANNEYFAKFFDVSKVRVSEVINSLVEKGFLESLVDRDKGNKRTLKTLANFSLRPSQSNLDDPHKESFKHSNTFNNTVNKDSEHSSGSQESLFSQEPSGSKKKKPAKEKVADECYAEFVAVWAEAYPILIRGFNGADGRMINEIIQKTRKHVIGSSKLPERELVVNTFKFVIAYVKRENHFCDGKALTTWNGQYLSIIHEISNGKKHQSSRPSTTDLINSFR